MLYLVEEVDGMTEEGEGDCGMGRGWGGDVSGVFVAAGREKGSNIGEEENWLASCRATWRSISSLRSEEVWGERLEAGGGGGGRGGGARAGAEGRPFPSTAAGTSTSAVGWTGRPLYPPKPSKV